MKNQGASAAVFAGKSFVRAWSRLLAFSLALFCLAALAQSPAPSQSIGEVEQLRGAGFAQAPGQLPRVLGKGLPLSEGDRLTTSDNALAIIKLKDGTMLTLRPNTELVLSQYSYRESSSSNNAMVLQLLRGGLRALTGLISKTSPNAAKIQTNTATIGIRGTDFDARICKSGECGATSTATSRVAAATGTAPQGNIATISPIAASARVLQQQGQATALDEQGQRRVLSAGASVYPGEIVETAANSTALLAFRDESKINLGASTRLRVDDFSFNAAEPGAGRNFVSLLRGSLRAVTGLIGKANRQNVRFTSSTATIGIRGTEFVMDCTGLCAGEVTPGNAGSGLTVFTFDGVVVVNLTPLVLPGQTVPLIDAIELVAGRGVVVSGQTNAAGAPQVEQLVAPPGQALPASPAGVVIPPNTFSQVSVADDAEGLFVFVREGHIVITTERQQLDLGRNESAFSGPALEVVRLQNTPGHVVRDAVPLPTTANINISGLRPMRSTDPICR